MTLLPGGLIDGQRRARALQLVGGADWYIAEKGRFDFVGRGDISEADMRAVHRELPDAVFVCVWRPKALDDVLPPNKMFTRRIARTTRAAGAVHPKLQWVAKGARIAVLPGLGVRWVDGERFYKPGEVVPLPWTNPPIDLIVVRPAELSRALTETIGPDGPTRAGRPDLRPSGAARSRSSTVSRLRRDSAPD